MLAGRNPEGDVAEDRVGGAGIAERNGILQPYMKNTQILLCPSSGKGANALIDGPGSDTTSQLKVTWDKNIGANEWVVGIADPTHPYIDGRGNVNESQLARPADLSVLGDSVFATYQAAWYIGNASYDGSWSNTPDVLSTQYARHAGGSNLAYGDGHAKWMNQKAMNWNPSLTLPDGTQCPAAPNGDKWGAFDLYCYNIPTKIDDKRVN